MEGTWNAAIYADLLPHAAADDVYVAKNRMSGLWSEEQPLWKKLVEMRTTTLLFAGVNTDQCVGGTLSNAYNAGWDCVLVDDCCGTPTPDGRDVWVYNIAVSCLISFQQVSVCSSIFPVQIPSVMQYNLDMFHRAPSISHSEAQNDKRSSSKNKTGFNLNQSELLTSVHQAQPNAWRHQHDFVLPTLVPPSNQSLS